MLTVWKFPLTVDSKQEVEMPKSAGVMSVIEQENKPTLYMLVDPEGKKVKRTVSIYGTGHNIDQRRDLGIFIGTVSTYHGRLIWHVWIDRTHL